MKKLIVIVAFLVVGYKLLTIYQPPVPKLDPQYPEPYIVVYGRKTDGNTVHLQTELFDQRYRYRYVEVGADGPTPELQERMRRAGLDAASYTLPIVEVNARIRCNPAVDWVVEFYHVSISGKRL